MEGAEYRVIPETDHDRLSRMMQYAFAPHEFVEQPDDQAPTPAMEEPRGAYVAGELVATALLYSFQSHLRGNPVVLNGLGGVATPPEHRRHGYMRGLLGDVLHELRNRQVSLSALFPFSFPFYSKLGWQLAGHLLRYKLKTSYLAGFEPDATAYEFEASWHKPSADQLAVLQAIYNQWAARYDLTVERSADWWRARSLNRWGKPPIVYVCRNQAGIPQGYVLYRFKDHGNFRRTLQVLELAWTTVGAYRALLGFLFRHDSQAQEVSLLVPPGDKLLLLLDNPRVENIEVVPNHMLRIVSVEQALRDTCTLDATPGEPLPHPGSLTMRVADPLAPWNNGIFTVSVERDGGSLNVFCENTGSVRAEPAGDVSVRALAQLVGGYVSASDLYQAGKLKARDARVIKVLEALWPSCTPFHNELY